MRRLFKRIAEIGLVLTCISLSVNYLTPVPKLRVSGIVPGEPMSEAFARAEKVSQDNGMGARMLTIQGHQVLVGPWPGERVRLVVGPESTCGNLALRIGSRQSDSQKFCAALGQVVTRHSVFRNDPDTTLYVKTSGGWLWVDCAKGQVSQVGWGENREPPPHNPNWCREYSRWKCSECESARGPLKEEAPNH